MSCCCPKKNGGNNAAGRGGAPSRQSMKDRDNANEDERAVSWWREQQQGKGEDDSHAPFTNNHSNGNPAGTRPSYRTTSLEQSQSRMEHRNPLQKPYEIQTREKPLHPKNGDVIQPTLSARAGTSASRTTKHGETSSASNMEIFRPELSGSATGPIPPGRPSTSDNESIFRGVRNDGAQSSDRITAIEPVASEDFLDSPQTAQQDPSAKYVHKASLKLALPINDARKVDQSQQRKRQRSIPQLRKQSRQNKKDGRAISQKRGSDSRRNKYDDDNLSDVPSDVDSVTKERYLLACQMLKNTLMLKEKSLEPLEREFILSLLGDFEERSVFSEDQLSAVEQATLRLENDPIFRNLDVDRNTSRKAPPPSPMTAATLQRREKVKNTARVQTSSSTKPRGSRIPSDPNKHPHTATLAKPRGKRSFLSNPCNPRSSDYADAPADVLLLVREEDDLDHQASSDSTGIDGTRVQQNVRFDGWANHRSAEYPFTILGAGDPRLKPRVLTPSMMEAFGGFFPYVVSQSNFWLKFSLVRDGSSLATLLSSVRTSSHTIIAVETNDGEVFGSFTSTPWRTGSRWFGTREAFLWRLKQSRYTSSKKAARSNFESEMEVYPFTGYDVLVQYCTTKTIAVGGGDWIDNSCPFQDGPRGIGFMIDGDLAGGESNSCATFANPRLCKKASASNEFSIANLEVWTLTPCLNVRDAAKMEVQKLFLEEHRR